MAFHNPFGDGRAHLHTTEGAYLGTVHPVAKAKPFDQDSYLLQLGVRSAIKSFFACIEVIREIYDAVECGMVLCTTNVFRTRFESAQKEELEQLFRRGVHRIQLGDIVRVEDLKPILAKAGLEWPAAKLTVDVEGIKDRPHEVLRQLAREGGLKAITERLRYARLIAGRTGQILSWAHFLHSHLIIDTSAKAPADDWS